MLSGIHSFLLVSSISLYRCTTICLFTHQLMIIWVISSFERRRQWHPTPVLLPGKSHGRRSLVGCSPWGCKESDTTKQLSILMHSLKTAATAKSLQSCPTLCDPIDGSSQGSPVPGILQARTLEWVAISFSSA